MAGVLRWEDPPEPKPGGRRRDPRPWALVAAQLRDRPGNWALIEDACTNPNLTTRIKTGKGWWAPAGAFEARALAADGRFLVYARYIGEAS